MSELQSLSPTLAGIEPVNVYQVPEGYFEALVFYTLILVQEDQTPGILKGATRNPYTVPDNYFTGLADYILSLAKGDFVPEILKDATKQSPFVVPNGYFEGLADVIINRLKSVETESPRDELQKLSPLLSQLDKKLPFSTPAGYFDELSADVVASTKAVDLANEELENLSPVISGLKDNTVYTVPSQYFDSLPGVILNRVREHKPAKVVTVSFGKKLVKYAAAAILAGIIITAGILLPGRKESTATGTVVKVEEKLRIETENKLKELSDDELSNFIENHEASIPDMLTSAASTEIDSEDVKLMLADIPDAELKQYLVEYGDTKDVLTN